MMVGKTNTPEFGITAVTESELNGACRNPWDTVAHARRLVGRRRGRRRRGRAAARARLGRRRLDPHSRRLLRPLRAEAVARPRLGRAVRRAARSSCRRTGRSRSRVRDAAAFLDVLAGYEPGDAHWAPPPERPFLDEVGADPGRLRIAFTAEPPVPYPVDPRLRRRRARAPPTRSPSSATTSSSDAAVASTRPARGVREALAARRRRSTPCRHVAADAAQPGARRARRRDVERRVRARGRARCSARRAGRRVLGRRRRRPDARAREAAGAGRLGVRARRSVGAVRRGGEFTPFTPIVNVTGQPAARCRSTSSTGCRSAIQLIGPPAGEAVLFRLAAQLEAAHPWAERLPADRRRELDASERAAARRSSAIDEAGVVAGERPDDERMLEPVERARDRRRRADLATGRRRRSARRRRCGRTARAASSSGSRGSTRRSRLGSDVARAGRAGRASSRGRARGCRARRSPG